MVCVIVRKVSAHIFIISSSIHQYKLGIDTEPKELATSTWPINDTVCIKDAIIFVATKEVHGVYYRKEQ